MGNNNSNSDQLDYLLVNDMAQYPTNVVPVHVWKIKCITEKKDVYYVSKECPHVCPYGIDHEIDLKIQRMKPSQLTVDKSLFGNKNR